MIKLINAFYCFIVLFSFSLNAQASANEKQNFHAIPPKAQGVIIVDNLKEGNLIFMSGFVGKGTYYTRNEQGDACSIGSVPIIAGNFEETNISINRNKQLKIVIYSSEISNLLFEGKQIESSEYETSYDHHNITPSDLKVEFGLPSSISFILNPRRRWTSWFRGKLEAPKCI